MWSVFQQQAQEEYPTNKNLKEKKFPQNILKSFSNQKICLVPARFYTSKEKFWPDSFHQEVNHFLSSNYLTDLGPLANIISPCFLECRKPFAMGSEICLLNRNKRIMYPFYSPASKKKQTHQKSHNQNHNRCFCVSPSTSSPSEPRTSVACCHRISGRCIRFLQQIHQALHTTHHGHHVLARNHQESWGQPK